MRLSYSKWSVSEFAARWVHPSIRAGSDAFADHARFIGSHTIGGCLALFGLPAFLALRGAPAIGEVSILATMSVPVLLAYFVSRTGHLEIGVKGTLFWIAGLISIVSLYSGGLGSVLLLWLCVLPIEAAIYGGKRSLTVGLIAALAGFATVGVWPTVFGMPDPLPWLVNTSISYQFSVVATLCYITVLAFRLDDQRSQSRNRLSDEQNRFRLLAENATDLITRHDRNGTTLFASPAARPLFGTPAADLLSSGLFEKIHLQDRIIFLKAISDSAQGGKEQACEFRIRCRGNADRLWKWVEMRCRPARDQETGQIDVVSVTRDVTKNKEQELALQEATTKAEESNLAQRRFLATMSHELRTPLNSIVGFSDILQQELFGDMKNDRNREYVRLIQDSGQHLLNVVNDLLDMSRIEAGKYEMSLEAFPIADLAQATAKMLQPMATKAKVSVSCDVSSALPEITADRRACRQVLINLLSNAIKFSPQGGSVRVVVKQHGRSLKLKVKDNGIGMTPEFVSALGQPFMQADNGRDREFAGSGLGLSVVKGLVSLHRGAFNVQSTKGEGTTVTVTLPIKAQIARPVPADEEARLVRLNDAGTQKLPSTKQIPVTENLATENPATENPVTENPVTENPVTENKGDNRARVSA